LREGNPEIAEIHLQQALSRGYFLPGLVYNLLACICACRSDTPGVESNLERAAACYPHRVVLENQRRLDNWLVSGGRHSGMTLALDPGDGWESACICRQPEFPDLLDLEVGGFLNMAKGYQTTEMDTV
jgi:hypothetical protein